MARPWLLLDDFVDRLRDVFRDEDDRLEELRELRRAPEPDPERELEDVGVRVAILRD